jgi:hypothetical protein
VLETMTRYEEMERCKNHKSFVLHTLLFILAFPMLHTSQDAFLGGVLVHVMSLSLVFVRISMAVRPFPVVNFI